MHNKDHSQAAAYVLSRLVTGLATIRGLASVVRQ